MEKSFTHLSKNGVHMVEVSDKPVVKRTAISEGKIDLKKET
ncbi:MAG: cyclic pyranopterin monophosphate synthase MoaC, partial [Methanobacterium sp.]